MDQSAAGRPELWKIAFNLFLTSPVFGVGFNGYAMSVGGIKTGFGDTLHQGQDVHNIYMRILCEQGVIGFGLFLLILARSMLSGWRLFRVSDEPFLKGLGFGFMGCAVSVTVTNVFGDRWSYPVLGSYFWILWGVVDAVLVRTKMQTNGQLNRQLN